MTERELKNHRLPKKCLHQYSLLPIPKLPKMVLSYRERFVYKNNKMQNSMLRKLQNLEQNKPLVSS